MKKLMCVLLLLVMTAAMLSGGAAVAEQKEKVVVALWGNQMLDSYTQYLCELFPQVEFEFVLATNSTDYYRFRQDHDDMPDILSLSLIHI